MLPYIQTSLELQDHSRPLSVVELDACALFFKKGFALYGRTTQR
jgi:hypothetical protein